jgi:hypothetical protein
MAIRSDNNPSNAAPSSGIDSNDLEKYGVWVKAEPHDIIEENGEPGSDFKSRTEASAVPEESFLSEDEERLLGSFDSEFDANQSAEDFSSELGPLPDISETLESSKNDDFEDLDVSLEDISPVDERPAIHAGSDLDISTVRGLDSSEHTQTASPSGSSSEMEDVSAQFLDDSSPSEASRASLEEPTSNFGIDDVTSQFLVESDDSIPVATPADTPQDFESLDIDLQFDNDTESPPPSSRSKAGEFDDVAAVEASLSDSKDEGGFGSPEDRSRRTSSDLSSELLMKIAEELKNIRGELVALKTQISGIAVPADSSTASSNEESSGGGFFSKDDDKNIVALTGDELDNILNTADFTEENAETAPESLLEEPLLPESGEYTTDRREATPAIEEIKLGEPGSVDEIEEVPLESSFSDLASVAEEGVHAMTAPPEDSSYLESDDVSLQDDLSLEGAPPLEDVPLVEPDLSEFEIESDEESPLEVSEELPLASEAQEIKLDIDAPVDYSQGSQLPEAEALEPIPEMESSLYEEISLNDNLEEAKSLEPSSIPSVEDVSEVEELDEFVASPLSSSPLKEPLSFGTENKEVDEAVPFSEEPSVIDVLPSSTEEVGFTKATEAKAAPSDAEPQKSSDDRLKAEIRSVLSYLDKLLDSLPEDKIEEFARSEYFDTYKRLFEELGLV